MDKNKEEKEKLKEAFQGLWGDPENLPPEERKRLKLERFYKQYPQFRPK